MTIVVEKLIFSHCEFFFSQENKLTEKVSSCGKECSIGIKPNMFISGRKQGFQKYMCIYD